MKLAKLFDKFKKEEREFFGIGTDFFLIISNEKQRFFGRTKFIQRK